jgi:hypothetical protein
MESCTRFPLICSTGGLMDTPSEPQKFDAVMRKILTVSKDELKKREKVLKRKRKEKAGDFLARLGLRHESPYLPRPHDLVLGRSQLCQRKRPTAMQLLGADTHLRAEAKLRAVCKTGRCVPIHGC